GTGSDAGAVAYVGRRMNERARVDERAFVHGGEGLAGKGHGEARIADPEDAGISGFEIAAAGEDGTGAGVEGALECGVVLREDDGVGSGVSEGGDAVELGGGELGGGGADEGGELGEGETVW